MSLSEAVKDACDQSERCARAKQITFSHAVPGGILVDGDPEALRRLFLILIDNAIKYTPSGGSISVSLKCSDGHTICEVSDSGIGIPPNHIPRIFERFYRVDQARSRETGGAGLGLAIARCIADAHRAVIDVESTVGHGSMFRVRMPAGQPTPSIDISASAIGSA
jgi:signal transduction histidine kinase